MEILIRVFSSWLPDLQLLKQWEYLWTHMRWNLELGQPGALLLLLFNEVTNSSGFIFCLCLATYQEEVICSKLLTGGGAMDNNVPLVAWIMPYSLPITAGGRDLLPDLWNWSSSCSFAWTNLSDMFLLPGDLMEDVRCFYVSEPPWWIKYNDCLRLIRAVSNFSEGIQ